MHDKIQLSLNDTSFFFFFFKFCLFRQPQWTLNGSQYEIKVKTSSFIQGFVLTDVTAYKN